MQVYVRSYFKESRALEVLEAIATSINTLKYSQIPLYTQFLQHMLSGEYFVGAGFYCICMSGCPLLGYANLEC